MGSLNTIRKSVGAGLLISLGAYAVLYMENTYVAAVLFTLGLLTICKLQLCLFTGKCGFILETHAWKELGIILLGNMVTGYLMGWVFRYMTPAVATVAEAKVAAWEMTPAFFIKAMLCGAIMYTAVRLYQAGTCMGIFIGIPLFILCGFQHCIANVIYMGAAGTVHPALLLAVVGNVAGSLVFWYTMPQETSRNAST